MRYRLMLLLFLSFFHLLWAIARAQSFQIEACAPVKCGSVNISYPFWSSDKQQPDYCGYPSLEINCRDEKPILVQSYDQSYYIRRVFYHNSSVLLVNSRWVNPNCTVNRSNNLLGLGPMEVSTTNKELQFFSRCGKTVSNSSLPPEYFPIACPGNGNESFVRLLQNYSDDAPAAPRIQSLASCSVSRIPVTGWNGSTVEQYKALLNDGFLVELKVTGCSDCRNTGGKCGFNTNTSMFMCVCPDGHGYATSCSRGKMLTAKKKDILITGTSLGSLAFIIACLILIVKLQTCKSCTECILWRKDSQENIETLLEKCGSFSPKIYKYGEVKKITRSFQDTLGKGGFGTVYKGILLDGRLVAVKILHRSSTLGEDFLNEVLSIGRTSHVNVLNLVGFCIEESKHALIYEFMPNGSLDNYIYSENPKSVLGWEKLYEIALGIARGLEYLHRGCNTRIVHFDIKPQNILLDEDFNPKIADFGLAKLCQPKESIVSMAEMRGTIGYIAPEVFSRCFGVVSAKSDVYSYGMMVLEMVGGRRNAKPGAENESHAFFPHWLYDRLAEGCQIQASDVSIEDEEIAKKMGIVGLWCTQTIPANRPSMSRVVEMMQKGLDELEMPPKPFSFSPPHSTLLSIDNSSTSIR